LKVNNQVVDEKTVTIGPGATVTVEFTRTLQTGTYNVTVDNMAPVTVTVQKPATFELSNLTVTPESGLAPLSIIVRVNVTNSGDVAGDYTVQLKVNNQVVDEKTVTIGPGATVTVEFTRTLQTGTYNVTVDNMAPRIISVKSGISLVQLVNAATRVKAYYNRYGRLPSTVIINGQRYTMSQLLYLLCMATVNINKGDLGPITLKNVKSPLNPSGSYRHGRLYRSSYVQVANNILTFIKRYNRAPNYARTILGRIPFQRLVYMYSKIIAFYGTNNRLPRYVMI
ncbi:MAG: pseudomurein-binding repeat-containing protein, partial [Methanothermobacter sp.]|nr:pseudomurein-binding repeat-containing protein [Methanothermobacter sp.]